MKQIGFTLCRLTLACSWVLLFCSNAAQPGVWDAGGGGFNFLFPEDSAAFQKIQMQQERIAIQLYRGFAVVKGSYRMQNTTSDTIRIKVGYPVEGVFAGRHHDLNQVVFDGLYQLQVWQDGQKQTLLQTPAGELEQLDQTYENDNWYVWESVFLPGALTEITVYFLVNTNNAYIRSGYAGDDHNALIYILESGSIWKQPIKRAEFLIQLQDDLPLKAIHGLSPGIDFRYAPSERLLYGVRTDFSPGPADNLVINYSEQQSDFDFAIKANDAQAYFQVIDQLAALNTEGLSWQDYEEKDPYHVKSSNLVTLAFVGIFIVLPTLFIALLLYLIFRIFRRS